VAVSELKRPLRNRFEIETVTVHVYNGRSLCNGHSPTDTIFRSGVPGTGTGTGSGCVGNFPNGQRQRFILKMGY
jgi:hypothetical protein